MPNLTRFLEAQSPIYPQTLAELHAGHKRTHWMWFIFPQIHGLGSSPTARLYAIASLAEAQAYLAHPILGPRLVECTAAVNAHAATRSISDIFPYPDDLKFHSSITLFAHAAAPGPSPFAHALALFFNQQPDPATLARLTSAPSR